jgi:hypothetical protein
MSRREVFNINSRLRREGAKPYTALTPGGNATYETFADIRSHCGSAKDRRFKSSRSDHLRQSIKFLVFVPDRPD